MTRLDELRAGGRLEATGTFDLDPTLAREKLGRYQLVDPHRYVLQFVQAAQLLGATKIEFAIDTNDVRMKFDGESPSAADLGEIYLHAFGRRGVARFDALRHLALGVIAAEAVDPAFVEVGGRHARLLVQDGSERVTDDRLASGNRIHVHERFRVAHVWEFLTSFRREPAELVALRDARHARPRIIVNGTLLNARESKAESRWRVAVSTAFEQGWVAVDRGGHGLVEFVQHGVVIERMPLAFGELVVRGVIESRRVATNLSHSAFVRNHAWDELISSVVMPAALKCADAALGRRLAGSNLALIREVVRAALTCRADHLRRRSSPPEAVDRVLMRLADQEIWRRLPTSADRRERASTREVLEAIGERRARWPRGAERPMGGPLVVSTHDAPLTVLRDDGGRLIEQVLLATRREPLQPALLAEATGRPVLDVTDAVQEQERRRTQDAAVVRGRDGLTGERPARLARDRYAHIGTAKADGVVVQVGVDVPIARTTEIVVAFDRDVHERATQSVFPLAGCTVLVSFTKASDEPLAELVRRAAPLVASASVHLLTQTDRPGCFPRDLALDLLAAIARGTLQADLCRSLGWSDGETEALASPPLNELRFATAIPWVDLVGRSERWSIAQIRAHARDDVVRISYIPASSRRRALQIEWEIGLVGGDVVFWLDDRGVDVLAAQFGAESLVDVEEQLRTTAASTMRQRRGITEEPVLHDLFIEKRSIAGPQVDGEVGMMSVTGSGSVELVILHQGRRLAHRQFPCRNGQFRAIVQDADLRAEPDLGDVVEDEHYELLRQRIISLCHEMFEGWCLQTIASDEVQEAETLGLWRAVVGASNSDHAYRLDWPVFATTAGVLSLRELRERVSDGKLEIVHGRDQFDRFALRLPHAPVEHLELLAMLLPSTRLARNHPRQEVSGSEPLVSHEAGAERPTPMPESSASLVDWLCEIGFVLDAIEVVDDSILEPRLDARLLYLARAHPLAELLRDQPADSSTFAAFAIALHARDIAALVRIADAIIKLLGSTMR